MKVVLISLARRGGMVHFHAELANALASLTSVAIVCSADVAASHFPKKMMRLTIDTGHGAVGSLIKALDPFTWYRLLRLLKQADADLFHIVAPHEWNPILVLLLKVLHKPLVYTVHDPAPHRGAPVRMRISNTLVARTADALAVLTKYGRAQLLSAGFPKQKVFTIPLGVYSAFAKRERNGTRTEKVILFFGRIEPYKGLQILLSAFSRIRDVLPGWSLLIAGTGHLPPGARQGHNGPVRILNRYVRDHEIAQMMGRARFVVLPYLEATQSAVVATAYAFAKPVIVTRVGGLPEMVVHGRTGLVVPPNDVKALARAMETLACNPRRLRRMGNLAYTISRARWSWDKIARMYLSMYESVLKSRPIT